MIRPVFAQPETQKMKMTRAIRMMEPKEETRPMITPVKADEGDEESPMVATSRASCYRDGCVRVRAYASYRSVDDRSGTGGRRTASPPRKKHPENAIAGEEDAPARRFRAREGGFCGGVEAGGMGWDGETEEERGWLVQTQRGPRFTSPQPNQPMPMMDDSGQVDRSRKQIAKAEKSATQDVARRRKKR